MLWRLLAKPWYVEGFSAGAVSAMRYDPSELYQGMALAVPQSGETTDGFRGCGESVVARSERAGLQSLGENVGSGKAAPPPAVRKPVAFRQATEPEELNLKPGVRKG